ncbi:MAG: ribonuclease III [SAR202 cluster bacterium Io17-Chloro-G9]|nr:MAG: ribonuclease III [SAR202 cluster bacterium Io17-Chloro-G9]
MPVERLETVLGLEFRDSRLLRQALVHRSYLNEQDGPPGGSNDGSYERMEFLGDAVLELMVSTELYRRFPDMDEGELTKSRASLVCRETLAQVARRLQLGEFLLVGKGEEATGGRYRDSILASAFEAVVAAVYLDLGYPEATRFLNQVMSSELDQVVLEGQPPENPKSNLQEYVQGLGRAAPHYRLVSSDGPDHSPVFTVEVLVEDEVVGTGRGGRKADAERTAAKDAMLRLVPVSDRDEPA